MNLLRILAVSALSSSVAFAAPYTFNGHININIEPNTKTMNTPQALEIVLPRIKLSPESKAYLSKQLQTYPRGALQNHPLSTELPPKMELGMEGTPVLNQGRHGSCVTFAITAAIDTVLGAGDYLSQLCSLELGSWLAIHDKQEYSGWEGSTGTVVLNQLMKYGMISKNHEKLHGCAGVHTYPLKDENDEGRSMSKTEYTRSSIPLSRMLRWSTVLNSADAFTGASSPEEIIWQTKEQLAKGHRPVIAMMLDVYVGHAGALGSYKAEHDTWMLTPQIILDAVHGTIDAAHEMVVTGYDDNALVTDEEGNVNKGVFTLRNSWSDQAGDQGNYYVSYEHFAFFTFDSQIILLKK